MLLTAAKEWEPCEAGPGQLCLQQVGVGLTAPLRMASIVFVRANVVVRVSGPVDVCQELAQWVDGLVATQLEQEGTDSIDPKSRAVVLDGPVPSRAVPPPARPRDDDVLLIEEPQATGIFGRVVPDDQKEVRIVVRVLRDDVNIVTLFNGSVREHLPVPADRRMVRDIALVDGWTIITATARGPDGAGGQRILGVQSVGIMTESAAARARALMPYPEFMKE
jgi:hypothetical protein